MQGTFGSGSESDDFFRRVISETSRLGPGESVTIAECAPERATRWEVRLDPVGTPIVTAWSASWPDLSGAAGTLSAGELGKHFTPATRGRLLIAHVHPANGTADPGQGPDAIAFDHCVSRGDSERFCAPPHRAGRVHLIPRGEEGGSAHPAGTSSPDCGLDCRWEADPHDAARSSRLGWSVASSVSSGPGLSLAEKPLDGVRWCLRVH